MKNAFQTDGRTDGPTDGPTDGRTEGRVVAQCSQHRSFEREIAGSFPVSLVVAIQRGRLPQVDGLANVTQHAWRGSVKLAYFGK